MYTLREKNNKTGVTLNRELGNSYYKIRIINKDGKVNAAFFNAFGRRFGISYDDAMRDKKEQFDKIYGFVSNDKDNGDFELECDNDCDYFIVNENGTTFERL